MNASENVTPAAEQPLADVLGAQMRAMDVIEALLFAIDAMAVKEQNHPLSLLVDLAQAKLGAVHEEIDRLCIQIHKQQRAAHV